MLRKILPLLKRFSVRAGLVIGMIVIWASLWEELQSQMPFLEAGQLKYHEWLSELNPRKSRVHWATVVEIDDESFWNEPFNGQQPTNRRALADLALTIAKAGATVIAFDIQMRSHLAEPGDSQARREDNDYLLKAIGQITRQGVAVVLTRGLDCNEEGECKEEPNVFKDEELPAGASLGHINLPYDRRYIPLRMRGESWDGTSTKYFDSFAQQIVAAYETTANVKRKTTENRFIQEAIRRDDFVYAGFIPESEFDRISAGELLKGSVSDAEKCRHRIVIIGGTWHQRAGRGPLIESFKSPVGTIPGVYLHANYVEALNDDRFGIAAPRWAAILLDLLAAVLVYLAFLRAKRTATKIAVLFMAIVFLSAPYVFATNFGMYIDFVAVLSLCLVHLAIEHYFELRAHAKRLK
jgi:CHASE2 domain-containing sensor protein